METLKPALRVLAHAGMHGAQIGSAAGLVLVLPRSLWCDKAPTIGGAACMAGAGLLLGSATGKIYAGVSMLRKEKEEIEEKADKLYASEKFVVDKASHASAAVGVAYGVMRLVNISKTENISLGATFASKRGMWIIVSYAALAVGVVVVSATVMRGGHMAVKKIKSRMAEKDEDTAAEEAVDQIVNGAVNAEAPATEKKGGDTVGDKTE